MLLVGREIDDTMRVLQRYILTELIRVFALVLSVLTVLLVFVGVVNEVNALQLGPSQVLAILPYIVPAMLPFTIPATLLLTVCVVYSRLAANQEVTASRAAGISVWSLMAPSFCLGAVLSVCSLLLTDQVIPWSVGKIQRTVTAAMEDIFLDQLRNDLMFSDDKRGISITVAGVEGRTLLRPTFRYQSRDGEPVTIMADEAEIKFDLERHEVSMSFKRANSTIPGPGGLWAAEHEIPGFPLTPLFDKQKPRHQTMEKIRDEVSEIEAERSATAETRDIEVALIAATGNFEQFFDGTFNTYDHQFALRAKDYDKLRTELHSRFAMACSCFFFVLVGSPFSILQARKQFLTSFSFCFMPILVVYYPIVMLMMNLCKTGTIDPLWAVWVGNVLLLAGGGVLLRRTLRC
ncbi:MAG: hypothetical protein CMJ48_00535 [Planctomycetaceae bacterium]|nr:hypothetical protein [Planctomycetaceae bacterium]